MIAALWIPDLPLQALQRISDAVPDDTRAFGVVDRDDYHGGTLVQHASVAARERGVAPGMTLAQARARVPELGVEVRRHAAEVSAVQALADVAHSFSPRFEVYEPGDARLGWALVDVEGLGTLIGPPSAVAAALAAALKHVGLEGRVGVARTTTLARLVARGGDGCQALPPDPEAERAMVADLPLAVLEPSRLLDGVLRRFGLRRVGDLLMLGDTSPAELGLRLGKEGTDLYRAARGDEVGVGLQPQPDRDRHLVYEGVELDYGIIELEPLAFVLRGILDRLVARLSLRGLLAGDVHLSLGYDGLGGCERVVEVAAPTRDVRSLLSLCRLRLEKEPPDAAVSSVGVRITACTARPRQLSFFEPKGPRPDKLAVTVARLTALCGDDRVGSPRPVDTYQDDAFSVEPLSTNPQDHERAAPAHAGSEAPVPLLAMRRFRPPRQVDVLCYSGRPVRLEGAGLGGRIVSWSGPFRRQATWWHPDRGTRADTYDVQLADGVYYRLQLDARAQIWWVLGWYD